MLRYEQSFERDPCEVEWKRYIAFSHKIVHLTLANHTLIVASRLPLTFEKS
ncbi:hypothetical protein KIN20_014217 [Parelaphostrongylus tenuis]|uniref:Uncharacterized protein n=1 Tax=Parelaphostrongylus tenuis TaxID=148309 RepID=A0AAD5QP46_PARTN|nr:hypothetical protein KIN20_014217 [Parelaphostrongylus tenuis]